MDICHQVYGKVVKNTCTKRECQFNIISFKEVFKQTGCNVWLFVVTGIIVLVYDPPHEKTNNVVSKTELWKHRRWLEAGNFGFRK